MERPIFICISNEKDFREVFNDINKATLVTNNLKQIIAQDIKTDKIPHLNLQYQAHCDDEGLADFVVTRAKFGTYAIYIFVEFISTVSK